MFLNQEVVWKGQCITVSVYIILLYTSSRMLRSSSSKHAPKICLRILFVHSIIHSINIYWSPTMFYVYVLQVLCWGYSSKQERQNLSCPHWVYILIRETYKKHKNKLVITIFLGSKKTEHCVARPCQEEYIWVETWVSPLCKCLV